MAKEPYSFYMEFKKLQPGAKADRSTCGAAPA